MGTEVPRISAIRDRLVKRVLAEIPDSHLNGHPEQRLPNNAHFRFDGVEGEAMVLSLRDEASPPPPAPPAARRRWSRRTPSSRAACCTKRRTAPSSSRSGAGAARDVDRIMAVLPGVIARLRALSPLYKTKAPAARLIRKA